MAIFPFGIQYFLVQRIAFWLKGILINENDHCEH